MTEHQDPSEEIDIIAAIRDVIAQRDAALKRVRELEAMRAAFLESVVAERVAAVLAERGRHG